MIRSFDLGKEFTAALHALPGCSKIFLAVARTTSTSQDTLPSKTSIDSQEDWTLPDYWECGAVIWLIAGHYWNVDTITIQTPIHLQLAISSRLSYLGKICTVLQQFFHLPKNRLKEKPIGPMKYAREMGKPWLKKAFQGGSGWKLQYDTPSVCSNDDTP